MQFSTSPEGRISFSHIPVYHALVGSLLVVVWLGAMGCGVLGGEDTGAPSAPSNVTPQSGDSQVKLGWDSVNAGDLNGYNLYRSTSTIDDLESVEPINSEALSDTSYTDRAVENGTVYHYRVTAVDKNNNESDPSAEVQVRPFASPPRP